MKNKQQCPEFPHFGARYPDARCIDGFLWDLDWCDEKGNLTKGGEDPCPFCNSEILIEQLLEDEEFKNKEEAIVERNKFWIKYGYHET